MIFQWNFTKIQTFYLDLKGSTNSGPTYISHSLHSLFYSLDFNHIGFALPLEHTKLICSSRFFYTFIIFTCSVLSPDSCLGFSLSPFKLQVKYNFQGEDFTQPFLYSSYCLALWSLSPLPPTEIVTFISLHVCYLPLPSQIQPAWGVETSLHPQCLKGYLMHNLAQQTFNEEIN